MENTALQVQATPLTEGNKERLQNCKKREVCENWNFGGILLCARQRSLQRRILDRNCWKEDMVGLKTSSVVHRKSER